MAGERIQVLLALSTGLVGEGIQSLLEREPDLHLVGIATSGSAALDGVVQAQPEVVLLDATLPHHPDADAPALITIITQLRRLMYAPQVIVLASAVEVQCFAQSAAAGALSYLLMSSPLPLLLEAIRAAARGERRLDPAVGPGLFHQYAATDASRDRVIDRRRVALSAREREVLTLKEQGQTIRAIAGQLCIAVPTVKSHLTRVHQKLNAADDDSTR